MDNEVLERRTSDRDPHSRGFLNSHFEFDVTRVVDEDAVATGGDVEGNAFVSLLGGSATVSIPY